VADPDAVGLPLAPAVLGAVDGARVEGVVASPEEAVVGCSVAEAAVDPVGA
jgi:hypothetical protein